MSTHPQSALLPYLRDELDADERTRVADHLQGCAECRESAESLAALSAIRRAGSASESSGSNGLPGRAAIWGATSSAAGR